MQQDFDKLLSMAHKVLFLVEQKEDEMKEFAAKKAGISVVVSICGRGDCEVRKNYCRSG